MHWLHLKGPSSPVIWDLLQRLPLYQCLILIFKSKWRITWWYFSHTVKGGWYLSPGLDFARKWNFWGLILNHKIRFDLKMKDTHRFQNTTYSSGKEHEEWTQSVASKLTCDHTSKKQKLSLVFSPKRFTKRMRKSWR